MIYHITRQIYLAAAAIHYTITTRRRLAADYDARHAAHSTH